MEDYLNSILDGTNLKSWNKEDAGIASVLPFIVKYKKYKLIIYGADTAGFNISRWLKAHGIMPLYFIVQDKGKENTMLDGVEIIHISSLKAKISEHLPVAAVGGSYFLDKMETGAQLIKFLYEAGCDDFFSLTEKPSCQSVTQNVRYKWKYYIYQRRQQYINSLNSMADKESKEVFCEYIRAIMEDDFYRLPVKETKHKYFDDSLFKKLSNECIINCGLANGDTVFHAFESYGENIEKIYSIDSDAQEIERAKINLKCLPTDYMDKIQIHNVLIGNKNTLDSMFSNNRVSLIEMDFEGFELETLKGCINIIKKNRPVISVTAYHKEEDLIELPKFFNSLNMDYNIYLRKYASGYVGNLVYQEIVLYAVPIERCL